MLQKICRTKQRKCKNVRWLSILTPYKLIGLSVPDKGDEELKVSAYRTQTDKELNLGPGQEC